MDLSNEDFIAALKESPQGRELIEQARRAEQQQAERERAVEQLRGMQGDVDEQIAKLRKEEERARADFEKKREAMRAARQAWQEASSRYHGAIHRRTHVREQLRNFLAQTAPLEVHEADGALRNAQGEVRALVRSGVKADTIRDAQTVISNALAELAAIRESPDPKQHLERVRELREFAETVVNPTSIASAVEAEKANA
jgi:seryl-tRNA synthetase